MAGELDINNILKLVPHRYPFRLVDRVVECDGESHIVTFKNVTYNEPFFPGHFPQTPVMPGVLILEALAQTCGLLVSEVTGCARPMASFCISRALTRHASSCRSHRVIA